MIIPAPNKDVARFLLQSKLHKAKLEEVFHGVATVQIVESFEDTESFDDFEEKVNYQFRPLRKVLIKSIESFIILTVLRRSV